MNAIGIEYLDYSKPVPNTEVGEKKKKKESKTSGKKTLKKERQGKHVDDKSEGYWNWQRRRVTFGQGHPFEEEIQENNYASKG